ncbi:MAG TPA: hypothetical protein VL547_16665 [Dinghuibacter sp.]|uniref:hypothetical protein n=1 Tax=Dinghuibacter sp. TaxID=2024697 RepID=UPI002B5A75AA|nr:hypothetical protein [Dinghuibacter sp.]HTJ13672.1 hypothetical protein [Dinghuibacter sp.]
MTSAKLWIGLCIAACLTYSCSKNKYGDTPSLSLKSVSTNVVPYDSIQSLITFTFNLTEKQYNENDTLFVIIDVPNCEKDSARYVFQMTSLASGIPPTNVGGGFKGTLQASFGNGLYWQENGGYPDIESGYACNIGPTIQNDTCTFKFVLGHYQHYSDTVKAGPIVLLHG